MTTVVIPDLVEAGASRTGVATATQFFELGGGTLDYTGWSTDENGVRYKDTKYGTVTLSSQGDLAILTYSLSDTSDFTQALTGDDLISEAVLVRYRNGAVRKTESVNFWIQGSDDAPVIGVGDQDGTLTEAGASNTATRQLSIGDPDAGDTAAFDAEGWTATGDTGIYSRAGTYGTAYLNTATGVVTYVLDNERAATIALNDGQSATDRFDVTARDAAGHATTQSVSFAVTGSNTAPVFGTWNDPGQLREAGWLEGGTATATLTLTATDQDSGGQTLTYSGSGEGWTNNGDGTWTWTGEFGKATLNSATGKLDYTLDNAKANALGALDRRYERPTVAVSDGTSQSTATVTFTIRGTNDAPEVTAGAQSRSVFSNGTSTATAFLTVSDPEGDATSFDTTGWTRVTSGTYRNQFSFEGTYGTTYLNTATGLLTYVVDKAKAFTGDNFLKVGETGLDRVRIRVRDANGALTETPVTFSVTGSNHAPVISVAEGGDFTATAGSDSDTASVRLSVSDLDGVRDSVAFDTAVWTLQEGTTDIYTRSRAFGTVTLNTTTGVVTYVANGNAARRLAADQLATDTVGVVVRDANGGRDVQYLTFIFNGVNDGTNFTFGAQSGTVTFDANGSAGTGQSASIALIGKDVDTRDNDSLSYSVANGGQGLYGSVSVQTIDGVQTLVYTPGTASATTQSLQGIAYNDAFEVTVTDPWGATRTKTVTFSVKGTDHQPVVTVGLANDTGSASDDGLTSNATLTGYADALRWVEIWKVGAGGSQVYLGAARADASGVWTFTPGAGDLQDGAVSINVRQFDRRGKTTYPATVTPTFFTLDTSAGAPTVTVDVDTGTVGDLVTSDPTIRGRGEAGATVTVKEGNTVLGTAIVAGNGTWSFTPDLGAGAHTLSVSQVDKAGNSSAATSFAYTVSSPVADAPVDVVIEQDGRVSLTTAVAAADSKDPITFRTNDGWIANGDDSSGVERITYTKAFNGGVVTWDNGSLTWTVVPGSGTGEDAGSFTYSVTHNKGLTYQGSTDFGVVGKNVSETLRFRDAELHGGLDSVTATVSRHAGIATSEGDYVNLNRTTITISTGATSDLGGGGPATIELTNSSVLTFQGTATLHGDLAIGGDGTGKIVNTGTLTKTGGASSFVYADFKNTGTVKVDEGRLFLGGRNLDGNGTIQVNGAKNAALRLESTRGDGYVTVDLEGEGASLTLASAFRQQGVVDKIDDFGANDRITLGGISNARSASWSYSPADGGDRGTLTVSSGGQSIALVLFGQYTAQNFSVSGTGSTVTIGYRDTVSTTLATPLA